MTPTSPASPHHLDLATALTQCDSAPAPASVKPEIAGRPGLFIAQLVKQATGRYTAAYDFSEA